MNHVNKGLTLSVHVIIVSMSTFNCYHIVIMLHFDLICVRQRGRGLQSVTQIKYVLQCLSALTLAIRSVQW